MTLQTVDIGGKIKFEFETWVTSAPCAEFTYKNYATDHWCSDYDVYVDIDRETAKKLISVLQSYVEYKQ